MNGAVPLSDAGAAGCDDALLRSAAIRIGKQQRYGIARPRLDAKVTPPPGKSEQQNHVRLLRQELRQIAIDRSIAGREHMRDAFDAG